jgi:hypothetical protein
MPMSSKPSGVMKRTPHRGPLVEMDVTEPGSRIARQAILRRQLTQHPRQGALPLLGEPSLLLQLPVHETHHPILWRIRVDSMFCPSGSSR